MNGSLSWSTQGNKETTPESLQTPKLSHLPKEEKRGRRKHHCSRLNRTTLRQRMLAGFANKALQHCPGLQNCEQFVSEPAVNIRGCTWLVRRLVVRSQEWELLVCHSDLGGQTGAGSTGSELWAVDYPGVAGRSHCEDGEGATAPAQQMAASGRRSDTLRLALVRPAFLVSCCVSSGGAPGLRPPPRTPRSPPGGLCPKMLNIAFSPWCH